MCIIKSNFINFKLFFFVIKLVILNINSKKINITIAPNGCNKNFILLIFRGRLAIYLVPPHKGQGCPVALKNGHTPNSGKTYFIGIDIIGKRITYIESSKKTIFNAL